MKAARRHEAADVTDTREGLNHMNDGSMDEKEETAEGDKLVLAWRYGLLAPVENADLVLQSMAAGHRYRNTLTEITRGFRGAVRGVVEEDEKVVRLRGEAEAAQRTLDQCLLGLRAARAKKRSKEDDEAIREGVNAARRLRSEAVRRLEIARREALRTRQEDRDVMGERRNDLQRSARSESNVYWGTYLLEEAADKAAQRMPLYDGIEAPDPHFRRAERARPRVLDAATLEARGPAPDTPWNGEGRIGVQIQKGMSVELLLSGEDTRLGIVPQPAEADHRRSRETTNPKVLAARARNLANANPNKDRRSRFRYLRFRVGTVEGKRDPIFAVFPMVMHRPLPPGAIVKGAQIHRRFSAVKEEWWVTFSIEVDRSAFESVPNRTGMVGIDVGWRVVEEGLRVALAEDEQGRQLAHVLPARLLGGIDKTRELQGLRDDKLGLMRTALVGLLTQLEDLPEWMRAATRGRSEKVPDAATARERLLDWSSEARFVRLGATWSMRRFPGDEAAFELLRVWSEQERHLWTWQVQQSASAFAWRKDLARKFAARLCRTYAAIVVEDLDLSQLARVRTRDGAPGAADQLLDGSRANRHVAGVGELLGILAQTAARTGTKLIKVPCEDTTRECAGCGHINALTRQDRMKLVLACAACGSFWDQDANAARNLLARAAAARERPAAAPGVAPGESRWKKAKAARLEKERRMAEASER